MQMMKAGIPALALWAAMTVQAGAEVITLTPADPQPDPATLTEGLAVKYAYPPEVKSLRDAEHWLENAEPGEPLSGLKYIDTAEGEMTLTSTQATRVAAEITGFVHFSRPGPHKIDFYSNDGVQAWIGGEEVAKYDGRHPCEPAGFQDVNAPEAGWYELKIVYFQRLGSSCLLMKWDDLSEKPGWAKNEAFAYQK